MRDKASIHASSDRVEIGVSAASAGFAFAPSAEELRQGGVERLIQDLRSLKAMLARERGLLKTMQITRLKELDDVKLYLIASMQGYTELLKSDPAWAASASQRRRDEVKALYLEIARDADETMMLLQKARRAQDVLMQAIRRAVDVHRRRQRPYDAGPERSVIAPLAVRHDC